MYIIFIISVEEIHSVGTILLYTTENVLPNDNVSMSVGHLDHVLITSQDVIKMSDGHQNIVIR